MSADRVTKQASASEIPLKSLRTVIHHNVDGMLVIGPDGVILLANPAAESLLGRSAQGLAGTSFGAPLTLDTATEIDVIVAGSARTAEMRVVKIDWHGNPAFLASLRDVTDRKLAEVMLARVGAQHEAIAQLGKEAVSGLDPEALMTAAVRHVLHVTATDFAGVLSLLPGGDQLRLVASDWSTDPSDPVTRPPSAGSQPWYALKAGRSVVTEDPGGTRGAEAWPPGVASAATLPMNDHEHCYGAIVAASRSPRRFDHDEITFLQSVANLLAAAVARVRVEDQVRHQALHDALTGLPNRTLFLDRLEHALARSRRQRTGLAVLFADLDGFKQVNDSLGHHAGDEVLAGVAGRLADALRSSDSLARLGGDEFVMLLEDVESDDELRRAVERVQAAVTDAPFIVEGRSHALSITVGVSRADESHESPEDLVRDADVAMYRAKQLGRGRYVLFDRETREYAGKRVRVADDLRSALAAGQLRLLYQPIVSLRDGRVVEIEALLRWQHPERGLLEPSDFLEIAIERGLMVPIGTWVIREACRHAAAWQVEGASPTINVNMTPTELAQPGLRRIVRDAIEQGGQPVYLQLELTEGALIEDPSLPATLVDLNINLGVRTALDDFGTGYSSLAYLTRFKIDELKIDSAFIRMLAPGRESPIVAAIVSMARALDILVVAEGIETEEQAIEAGRLGCDRGQGFFFSRPLPPAAIAPLLQATGATTSVAPEG